MYTLVMLVIGLGTPGSPPSLATTHFPVPSEASCNQTARLLAADSTKSVLIKTFCVPRS